MIEPRLNYRAVDRSRCIAAAKEVSQRKSKKSNPTAVNPRIRSVLGVVQVHSDH